MEFAPGVEVHKTHFLKELELDVMMKVAAMTKRADISAGDTNNPDLKVVLEEIVESEARLRTIIDMVPSFLWTSRPDGAKEYLNQRWYDYTGLSAEEGKGWGWTVVVHPEDLDRLVREWAALVESRKPGELETRIRRYDGEYRWFLIRVVPQLDEQGNVVKWFGSNTDIEDRKRAEEKVRNEGLMINTIPALAWACRTDGTAEFLNQRWLDYTGFSLEQGCGWGWKAAIHPDDLEHLMKTWQGLLESGEPGEDEARLRRFDGEYRWFIFQARPVRDDQGRVVKWFGSNTDIEDRKQAEEKLRQDEIEFRQIADAIPHNMIVLRPDGTRLYANRTFLEYTGVKPEDVQSEGLLAQQLHPDDLERSNKQRQPGLGRGVPFEIEQRLRGKDGSYRWFLTRYNPLLDQEGHVVRWYATGTDIDDRKRGEERTQNENLVLREELDRSSMFEEIVGSSPALSNVLRQVAKVAATDSTVLILGETGTGKELIARAIHKQSRRSSRAFIRINCAAIPLPLVASELFGHEKGAFTGAVERRLGRFEAADGGTLLLDEIGDLPAETQIALMRVLQERELERVGSVKTIHVDVRVLAATNRDLEAAVADGTFRRDLYYRLNIFPIHIPPLRDRADDIPLLVEYLIERYSKKAGKKITSIGKDTLRLFQAYDWPGNIRELQNVVERAVILCEGENFHVDGTWLRRDSALRSGQVVALTPALVSSEREMIERALTESGGQVGGVSGAATKLRIPRQTLESKIKILRINKFRFKRT
jgi:formate hydrogenlyase transcriptional activator